MPRGDKLDGPLDGILGHSVQAMKALTQVLAP
jgi:hypothetical protein